MQRLKGIRVATSLSVKKMANTVWQSGQVATISTRELFTVIGELDIASRLTFRNERTGWQIVTGWNTAALSCSTPLLFCFLFSISAETTNAAVRPNVVLILCDDLNDFVEGMQGHRQASTPSLKEFARSGVMFRRAYSNNPICAPSRSCLFSGIYSHTARNLFWDPWNKNPIQSNSKTMMELFRENGYRVVGSGKTLHYHVPELWDEYPFTTDYGPLVSNGDSLVAHPSVPEPFRSIGVLDGSFGSLADVPYRDDDDPQSGWVYGQWNNKPFHYRDEENRSRTPDELVADWAIQRINQLVTESDQPFFMSIGFVRPHTPLHAPKKYFDKFPYDEVELPAIKPHDAVDCRHLEVMDPDCNGLRHFRLLKASYPTLDEGLRTFVRAYLACVAAADEQVGRVVKAIDDSPLRHNTIMLVTSDHGYNLGQKDYLFKNAPWEESTRIPLIVRVPGVTLAGKVVEEPVSLIDLYPTLIDLCHLDGNTVKNRQGRPLDGFSLRRLLEDPSPADWAGPDEALTMVYSGDDHGFDLSKQHWSLRSIRWRYIRYSNGAEELYDHDRDPHEWTNLSAQPAQSAVLTNFRHQLAERIGISE